MRTIPTKLAAAAAAISAIIAIACGTADAQQVGQQIIVKPQELKIPFVITPEYRVAQARQRQDHTAQYVAIGMGAFALGSAIGNRSTYPVYYDTRYRIISVPSAQQRRCWQWGPRGWEWVCQPYVVETGPRYVPSYAPNTAANYGPNAAANYGPNNAASYQPYDGRYAPNGSAAPYPQQDGASFANQQVDPRLSRGETCPQGTKAVPGIGCVEHVTDPARNWAAMPGIPANDKNCVGLQPGDTYNITLPGGGVQNRTCAPRAEVEAHRPR